MSKSDGQGQTPMIAIYAKQKALAHDLEVTVQGHLQRGELSMVEAAGMLRHVAALLDLRVMQHVQAAEQQESQIAIAPPGFDKGIRPQGE